MLAIVLNTKFERTVNVDVNRISPMEVSISFSANLQRERSYCFKIFTVINVDIVRNVPHSSEFF